MKKGYDPALVQATFQCPTCRNGVSLLVTPQKTIADFSCDCGERFVLCKKKGRWTILPILTLAPYPVDAKERLLVALVTSCVDNYRKRRRLDDDIEFMQFIDRFELGCGTRAAVKLFESIKSHRKRAA